MLDQQFIQFPMLIRSVKRPDGLRFEVSKEGLLKLKPFHNKKLRIIFNVSHHQEDMHQFNKVFLSAQDPLKEKNVSEAQGLYSYLQVSQLSQQLTDNRAIIFLNAYENSLEPDNSIQLLIIGYITASVFFYHNKEPHSQDSSLTSMLAALHKCLQATEILKLQEQIKHKSGFSKKPYFMCVSRPSDGEGINFSDFYKYQQIESKINEAVDMLSDYFPERSGLQISGQQTIKNLGEQFISHILGRKIFNFEITGLTLQNLCFELCEIFNTGIKKVDLVKIYNKIITNQKMRVYDIASQKYMSLTKNLIKQLPQEPLDLEEMHHHQIETFVIQESITDATNCMELSEYQFVYEKLVRQFKKIFQEIKDQNLVLRRNRIEKCYEKLEEIEEIESALSEISCDSLAETLEVIQRKIQLFIEETVPQFTTRDLLCRLIDTFLETLTSHLIEFIEEKDTLMMEFPAKIESLQQKNRKTEIQLKLTEEKCKKLEQRIIDITELKNEYKKKLSNHDTVDHSPLVSSQVLIQLRSKNRELEEEIAEKNVYIDNLTLTLSSFEVEFDKKYYKPKFSKEVNSLLSQITHKTNQIHETLDELKKTQVFYEKIKKQFESEKKKIDEERAEDKKNSAIEKAKFEKLIREKQSLQSVIEEARSAIKVMKNVESEFKDAINELQNRSGIQSCLQAESQQNLEDYKQCLKLTCEYIQSGKGEKLKNFHNVTENKEVKGMIKSVLKK